MIRRLLLLLALLALAAPAGALALTVDDVAKEVRCPVCNAPLNVSNGPQADRMRAYIRQRIDQGWSESRIIDDLKVQFGANVLATPPKSGFDLVAWIVPGIAVAIGLVTIGILTRLWARRRGPPEVVTRPVGPEAERLEDELRRLR